ncbi:DUF58 domain-containing protein [Demequina zhanjiangensis]|uniref:DUF58 domain-containing protein n=1 Tax=Demequina zhanjiangensis TaxID=3051659 RepID=A0ABT8FXS6_9MICO|nr:DUF58 domain-containing protein [Demequina sp. SYSU T00b26]MDN4471489.1 DUF58 domain-containing protein [Demequina sp. SYSU T00b26]
MNEHTEHHTSRTTDTSARGATVTRYAADRSTVAAGVERGRASAAKVAAALGKVWRVVDETVSPVGWLLAATALSGVVVAAVWGWAEGLIVGGTAATLLLLCLPFLLGAHTYAVRLDLERDRVVAGTSVQANLRIENRGLRIALPAVLDIPVGDGLVEAQVPFLRSSAVHEDALTISAERRGIISVGPMTIGRGDPLGVLRRDHTWPGEQTIYVHPVTTPIPPLSAGLIRDLEGQVTHTIVDSDLSFHAIREYLPGDSWRHVHWKSTAKTGRLMVRQYEETRRSRVAVMIDIDAHAYETEDEFESAVSVAASLSVQAVRDGREVAVTASSPLSEHDRGRVHSLQTLPTVSARGLLDAMSGLVSAPAAMSLPDVSTMTARETPELSLVFIATGSLRSAAELRRAAAAFPADVEVMAIRSEPGATPALKTAPELRVATIGMLHDLGHLMLRASA